MELNEWLLEKLFDERRELRLTVGTLVKACRETLVLGVDPTVKRVLLNAIEEGEVVLKAATHELTSDGYLRRKDGE